MSENIHKSHNVSKLMYHFVLPTKYRRYDMYFLEIGADKDHVHFLIQSVPTYTALLVYRLLDRAHYRPKDLNRKIKKIL